MVAGRLTQVEPGASKLVLTQQSLVVAFGPELSAFSMDPGLVNVKLVTACGGLFQCQGGGSGAAPPHTLAEFSLDQFGNLDFYDISLVDGFNVPMVFNSTSPECSSIDCTGDLNGNCPTELKAPGGCNNPCAVFKTKGYCCTAGADCKATNYSMFLKVGCPGAYTIPYYDATSAYSCPGGSNYNVLPSWFPLV